MNNFTFEDELQATWRRVSKRAARNAYERNERITLVPCNYRPFGMWHVEYTTNEHDHDVYTFDQLVNSFEFYNCNNEAGRSAARPQKKTTIKKWRPKTQHTQAPMWSTTWAFVVLRFRS